MFLLMDSKFCVTGKSCLRLTKNIKLKRIDIELDSLGTSNNVKEKRRMMPGKQQLIAIAIEDRIACLII